ncbi:MAG: Casein kinase I isoform epsilon, partial [Paramarteilia canceri]
DIDKEIKYKNIGRHKKTVDLNKWAKEIPSSFITSLKYCRQLKFEETPDYSYIRSLFALTFKEGNFGFDNIYDWHTNLSKNFSSPALKKVIKLLPDLA